MAEVERLRYWLPAGRWRCCQARRIASGGRCLWSGRCFGRPCYSARLPQQGPRLCGGWPPRSGCRRPRARPHGRSSGTVVDIIVVHGSGGTGKRHRRCRVRPSHCCFPGHRGSGESATRTGFRFQPRLCGLESVGKDALPACPSRVQFGYPQPVSC